MFLKQQIQFEEFFSKKNIKILRNVFKIGIKYI